MGQAATRWRAGEKSAKIIVIFLSLPHQELVKKFRDAGQKKSKIRLTPERCCDKLRPRPATGQPERESGKTLHRPGEAIFQV